MIPYDRFVPALNCLLPQAPAAIGGYAATTRVGSLLFVSGQLPFVDGKLAHCGKIGDERSFAYGLEAAKICALNILAQSFDALEGGLPSKAVKLEGYINCTSAFTEHAGVLDGASKLISSAVSGDSHSRIAIGCESLPENASVEIAAVFEI